MGKRKYIIVISLLWALMGITAVYIALEPQRMRIAQSQYTAGLVSSGRIVYAENCANCHGPAGEGVVGPPLYRPVYRGEPAKSPDAYALLTSTIIDGRPGTTDPFWARLTNGAYASYTGMSAWGRDKGGPLNRQQVEAIASFIMLGEWHDVAEVVPPPSLAKLPTGALDLVRIAALMPAGQGSPSEQGSTAGKRLSPEQVQVAKHLLQTKTCVQCHTIGRVGGQFGPDISKVGSWGTDREFLKRWIKNPQKVTRRAPEYWSNYGNPLLFAAQSPPPPKQAIPLGHTQMPVLDLSDAEVDLLATYLSSLK